MSVTAKKGNACVNGNLVIHWVPVIEGKLSVGKYIIYRVVDDQNWFWSFMPTKLKAMQLAHDVGGHAVEVKSIEF